MREIEDVVRTEAARAHVELEHIEIVQDQSRGIMARISLAHDSAGFRSAIGSYAFAYEIM
jgi:hypothetical protein